MRTPQTVKLGAVIVDCIHWHNLIKKTLDVDTKASYTRDNKGLVRVQQERQERAMERLEECYTVRGEGGFEACLVIQERLQRYGLCSYTRWDPDPPKWRFFFETNLKPEKTLALLGKYTERYRVAIRD